MQEEEKSNGEKHATETIGWLAIDTAQESSSATDAITGLQAATTGKDYTDSPKAVSYSSTFSSAPSLLAKLSCFDGIDPANLRISNLSTTGFTARVHEEQSADSETNHIPESLSYLALDGSSGDLIGNKYTIQSTI